MKDTYWRKHIKRNVKEISKEFKSIKFTTEMRGERINHDFSLRRLGLYNKHIFYYLNRLRKINNKTSSQQCGLMTIVSKLFQIPVIVKSDEILTRAQEVSIF